MATLPRIGLPAVLQLVACRLRERRAARALRRDVDRLGALSPHLLHDIGVEASAAPAPHLPPVHTGRSVA